MEQATAKIISMTVRINVNIADIRAKQFNRSERISQGLYNELIEVMENDNKMSLVKFPDGYQGWIGNQFTSNHNSFEGQGPYIVQSHLAPAYEKPDTSTRILTYIPYGCYLYGAVLAGYLKIISERYGTIFIREVDLIDESSLIPPANIESDKLVLEAEKFFGTPYLWGGRSFYGIDCSGFVAAIAARFGVRLPRDSKDQITQGTAIERAEVRRGDLIFFPGHVALAISNDLFIHSSREKGGIAYNSLDPKSSIYNHTLVEKYLTARRIFI
jgi:gamma-D-glutamyl-L-lysine dipeptidyl-peptidase